MGDTFHDPVDHVRTTRPHAGRAVIDVLGWPGYALLVLSMVVAMGCMVAFGTGHSHQGVEFATLSVLAAGLGALWLTMEHRRIRRVNVQWHETHPEADRQHSAS